MSSSVDDIAKAWAWSWRHVLTVRLSTPAEEEVSVAAGCGCCISVDGLGRTVGTNRANLGSWRHPSGHVNADLCSIGFCCTRARSPCPTLPVATAQSGENLTKT